MGFIRVKRIKGHKYAYFVENTWTSSGPRQQSKKYLGKVVEIEPSSEEDFRAWIKDDFANFLEKSEYKAIILDMIKFELDRGGFKEEEGVLGKDKLKIDLKNLKIIDGKKPLVIKLNDGFLCELTLKNLLDYDGENDSSGTRLASLLVNAGLHVEEEVFIALFDKKRKPEEESGEVSIYY